MSSTTDEFDVAILGTGITGTMLGAILARNGVRALLIENAVHPRFAIGESTVPDTTFLFRVVAGRYGVPEIGDLSTYNKIRRNISTTHGVKRNFSFMVHHEGQPLRPQECSQLSTLSPPMGPDVHFFRQDLDSYMLSVAAKYGATIRQRTDVVDIGFRPDGVELKTRQGSTIRAQYVVDAGGIKAPVAHALGLRHEKTTMRTHSRAMYTHMHGVAPFDACFVPQKEHGLPSPISQGTLHHLFDGGWMWVIPFNNHSKSTNRLVSVGLNLDPRKHPPTGMSPEEEFRSFVRRFPSLEKPFAKAVAIREWTSADRVQFSSKQVVGDRFCLMPHAAAFVDPLFSSGLSVAMSAINGLGWRLIAAKKDGDWSRKRFQPVEQRVLENFDYFDRLVSHSYVAFSNFELWNAWYKLWILASVYGSAGTLEVLGAAARKGPEELALSETAPYDLLQAGRIPNYANTFTAACGEIDAYEAGKQTAADAARKIREHIAGSGLWPKPWGNLDVRSPGIFTVPRVGRFIAWVKKEGPEFVKANYFNRFQLKDVLSMVAAEWGAELGYTRGLLSTLGRDFFRGFNNDWQAAD
jgi:FADH2 O2-dependent halogenase